jgi:hypothetical protein
MSDLVKRLAQRRQHLVFSRSGPAGSGLAGKAAELRAAIERKYVQLSFTETRGGTELGFSLDEAACKLCNADFAQARGQVHLEGELELDYVPVRLIADVDLSTLEGEGQLQILRRSASA